jgi:hypothetical protein
MAKRSHVERQRHASGGFPTEGSEGNEGDRANRFPSPVLRALCGGVVANGLNHRPPFVARLYRHTILQETPCPLKADDFQIRGDVLEVPHIEGMDR